MSRYRPKTRTETKEYREWKELASMKGKTLCTVQDLKRFMGKQEFEDAVYEHKLMKPVTVIAYRSYFFWPPDEGPEAMITD